VEIVNCANIWVIELRAELGFAFETLEVCGLLRELRREDLYDNGAVELSVEGLVNRTLTTGTDLFQYFVLVDLRTDHKEADSPPNTDESIARER
jgi:hypothetical protein